MIAFVNQIANEGAKVGLSLGIKTFVIVSQFGLAAALNEALPAMDPTDYVLVVDGCTLTPDWAEPIEAAFATGARIVSPYVVLGGEARPWHDKISPWAWAATVEVLQEVGGLVDVRFGSERVLGHKMGGWCLHTPLAVATPINDFERETRLGQYYYAQLEDQNRIKVIIEGN